jgi:hypothetical protein
VVKRMLVLILIETLVSTGKLSIRKTRQSFVGTFGLEIRPSQSLSLELSEILSLKTKKN